jgi:CHAT domain-containing protein/Tfp pilus assembly protein PilF
VLLPRDDGRYAITLESREFVGGPRRIEINVDLIDAANPSAKNTVTLVGAMTEAAAAFAQGETDHWKEAARRYESAAVLAHKVERVDLEAEMWFALANLRYLNLTDWNGAVEAAVHAKGAYRNQGNISGYAASLHVEGAALSELINEQPKAASPGEDTTRAGLSGKEARQRLEQAATIYSRLDDPYQRARVVNDLGLSYYYEGLYEPAEPKFEEAARIFKERGEWSEEIKPLNNLGLIAYEQGRLTDALRSFSRLLELLPPKGFEWLRGNILDNMGTAYRALGQIDNALSSFTEALALHERLGLSKSEGRSLTGIGVTYYSAGERALARDYLERALPIRRAANDGRGEAATLRYLGVLLLDEGEVERAIEAHRRSFELAVSPADRAKSQVLLGRDFGALNRIDDAINVYSQAVENAEAAHARHVLADALVERGGALAQLGQHHRATQDLKRARLLFAQTGFDAGSARAEYEFAQLALISGELEQAARHASSSIELIEHQRSEILSPDLKAAYLAAKQRYYELLTEIRIAESHSDPTHVWMALESDERSRTRAMLDLIAEADVLVGQDLDPPLRARRRQLLQRMSELRFHHEELLDRNAAPAAIDEVVRKLNRTETQLDVFQIRIREQSARYAELAVPRPLDALGIRRLLDDETLLLQFSLGVRTSYVFAVDSQGILWSELPPAHRLNEIAREVHEALRTNAPDRRSVAALQVALAQLADTTLQPFARRIAAHRRLVIVADEALAYVPFGVLPLDTGSGTRRLIETHEVIDVPSMTVLAAQRNRQHAQPALHTLAIFADPVFTVDDDRVERKVTPKSAESMRAAGMFDVERLPGTMDEATAIAAVVPEEERFIASGFAATREAVLDPALGEYKVIHFATHGFIDARYPSLSALVMSLTDPAGRPRDGLVRLQDIYSLRLRADLVTLSACETALGRQIKGEGLIGLTRGFLHAGARSVVASLWRVPDRATEELMGRFYRLMLERGLSPAAALRAAQLEQMQSRRWSHPFFWGGFVVQGDWQR